MFVHSVAGPDGFNVFFYQMCWDIIREDVVEAVKDFLSGTSLPIGVTATSIALIPKVKNPSQWSECQPISLCNTSKILTKLINDRLKLILIAFTYCSKSKRLCTQRLIGDNILLAQEVMHSLSANKKDWNVALKLDMAKAYDRVDWAFLEDRIFRYID
ncbi:UNVERIFIED_CONTAM: hypothetical protein Slati_1914500 [Sesamum latifolium]|uniref:Reverse transcriptase n=1 Tax=Sesamum latifolium TaxID=2727402 RepID=A0AAW2X6W5_9LAMI